MTVKLKWTVGEAPTGTFRSFHKRMWPSACEKHTGKMAVQLYCVDSYEPRNVREGKHGPIQIQVADHRNKTAGWEWRRLKERPATLAEAKALAQKFFDLHPEYLKNKGD